MLLFPQDGISADGALPGIKTKQRKELQLQEAFARDAAHFASALLALHSDSPVNLLGIVQLTQFSDEFFRTTQLKSITQFDGFCGNNLKRIAAINQGVTKP
jgi:hypothetical protein